MRGSISKIVAWGLGVLLCACTGAESHVAPGDQAQCGADAGASRCVDVTPPAHERPRDASTTAPTDAGVGTATIGPEGGRVSLPDGTSVEIPGSALDRDTSIAIHAVGDVAPLPGQFVLRGRAYAFEPHGTRFAEPVILHLPFTGEADGLTALRLDDDDDTSWENVSGAEAISGHVLELSVTHFSIYAAAAVPTTPDASPDASTPDASMVASCGVDNGGCGNPETVTCVEHAGAEPTCEDVDECAVDNGGCDALASCSNVFAAAPICGDCPPGYSGTGEAGCVDVDECVAGAVAACGDGATDCTNQPGDYTCTCDAEHLGSGSHACRTATYCDPLVPLPEETCYDFRAHGVSSPSDTTRFSVPVGESIDEFYFDVPWTAGAVAARTAFAVDAASVVAEAWLYDTGSNNVAGTVVTNAIGTVIGEEAELIDRWGPGGCGLALPADVGLHLPSASRRVMLMVHYYNATGAPQLDGSAFSVCTVDAGTRANVAGLTLLGTENLNGVLGIPTGNSNVSGTCINDSSGPITIVSLEPYAHRQAVHMTAIAHPVAGGTVVLLDHPYDFNYQVRYDASGYVLAAGDQLTTTCSYNNAAGANVRYGLSLEDEACYVFAIAYPYLALNNGVASLVGPTNTCW